MSKTIKPYLMVTTVIAGTMGLALPAFAQTQPQKTVPSAPVIGGSSSSELPSDAATQATPSTQADPSTEVVVTGSRIANPNATSASPLTVVSAQEIRAQGTTSTETLLNNLPQVFAGQGGNLSNGASGTATVDLRGLGPTRTLVLVNGRRLMPGDPSSSAADLNFVPATLIDRVEVLTGGASSTYGSDAISGVVNFVMNKHFEGFRIDAQYALNDHDNNNSTAQSVFGSSAGRGFPYPQGHTDQGFTKNITAVLGGSTADGRGHFTTYAGYREAQAVTQNGYDYSACSFAENNTALGFGCSGSGTTSPARFILNGGAGSSVTLDPATGNTFRPYVGTRDAFNFAPYNYYQRPDERYTAGAFADYKVSDAFDPYMEVMFMDDHSVAQIAPSGIFGQIINVNCDNPLLSASQRTAICGAVNGAGTGVAGTTGAVSIGKRNVEGGGRVSDIRHTDYRVVAGAKGDIDPAFSYDVYGQFGRVVYAENYQNDFSVQRTRQALNVVNINGVASCADATARSLGCVPYNIFQVGGVTQGALNYLQTPGFQEGSVTEYVANASITGDLGKYGFTSPLATDGIGINFGTEYRKEQLSLLTDAEFQTGDLAGQGGPTKSVTGQFDLYEFFGEIRVPLVQDRPGFQSLVATGGYRYSHYNLAGGTNTYKGGLEWKPVQPLLLRGSYNRAVRAPNIQELFSPTGQTLFAGSDPCAGAAVGGLVNGNTAAQCARSGVTAAQFGNIVVNSANQYTQFSGGNTALTPEVSDTISGGAVLAPGGFLHGLVISADYFDIKVRNTIGTVGAQIILNQCVQTGNPLFCNAVQRDPTNGSLFLGTVGQVVNTTLNVGKLQTKGVDVSGSYRFDFDRIGLNNAGSLGFDFSGTFLTELRNGPGTTLADGTSSYDCKGLYGVTCGTPNPKFRSKLRVTYNAPGNAQLSVNWRHYSGVNVDTSSNNSFLSGTVFASDYRLPSYDYIDISTAIRVADKFSLHLGMNNAFDRDPPIVGSSNLSAVTGNGNTYPQIYDTLGRYVYAGVTVDF